MEDMTAQRSGEDSGDVKKLLFSMKFLFGGIQVSPLIFLVVVIFVAKSGSFELSGADRVRGLFKFLPYIFMSFGLIFSIVVRAKTGRIMGVGENFLEGIKRYFSPMLLTLAACESAAIVCGMSILFGNEINTIIAPFVISIAAKWLHFPGKERLMETYTEGRRSFLEEQRLGEIRQY